MPDPKLLSIGGFALPLDLETLEALPVSPAGDFQFDFTFRDIRFAIRHEKQDELGLLRIVGDVGPMPFSAESPAARAGLHQIIRAANDDLSARFRVNAGRIIVGTAVSVEPPLTATKLIATVAAAMIPAVPYLDLIAIYIRPPLAPAKRGEVPLRREWRHKALAAPAKR